VCFLVNNNWCTDVKVISAGCTPDLEHITIKCRPFYLPREFSSVTLTLELIQSKLYARYMMLYLIMRTVTLEHYPLLLGILISKYEKYPPQLSSNGHLPYKRI
jgi:hypothetical protein